MCLIHPHIRSRSNVETISNYSSTVGFQSIDVTPKKLSPKITSVVLLSDLKDQDHDETIRGVMWLDPSFCPKITIYSLSANWIGISRFVTNPPAINMDYSFILVE